MGVKPSAVKLSEIGQEFFRCGIKFFHASFAAEFDLLAFMDQRDGVVDRAKFVVGDKADVFSVRLDSPSRSGG